MWQGMAQILVVDDEEAIRLTLETLLQRRGYEVTTAASGAEALALIEQRVFDLLLLDLKMPGLSGLDVARRARVLQPAVAILFLTGSSTIAGAPEEPDLEQFDVLIKTTSPQEVLEHVAAALKER
jgi:DNA-binding NtrC family response regulator